MSRRSARYRRAVYVWHRRLGLCAAAVLLVVAVTGVILNHSDRLGLATQTVSWSHLFTVYGMTDGGPTISYHLDSTWLTWHDQALYIDGRPLSIRLNDPTGAVATADFFVVSGDKELLLLDPDGVLIERISGAGLPTLPSRLGLAVGGEVALSDGGTTYLADADLLTWRRWPNADVVWSTSKAAPDTLADAVAKHRYGDGLSWERVLLDLHSGRLFGSLGPYVVDAAGLGIVILIVTGAYNWFVRRGR